MLVHKKIVLFFVLLTLQIVIAQSTRTNGVILPERGICAHRGAMETHPENTISAFKEAIRLGAHMIEFDVRMTKDGKLVIMHDKSVNRTTNGSGLVSDLTYDEIKKLDAGRWKSEMFKGERIPTLKETLQVMPHNIWLNIHLKEGPPNHMTKDVRSPFVTGFTRCCNQLAKKIACPCLSLAVLSLLIISSSPPSKVEGSDSKRVIEILRTGG